MSLSAGRNTIRYAVLIMVAMILLSGAVVSLWAGPVTLWHEGAAAVSSMLPDDWRNMPREELAKIYKDNRTIIPDQSGILVSGFYPGPEKNEEDPSYILVLAKGGERVAPEMIQKTYVWLQKNNELVKSMLPARAKAMHIENIEYRQDQPSIFFQTRLDMGEAVFIGVSAIFFLNNSYLNVVCIASERKFADYKGIFYSFINRVSIPGSLHYAFEPDAPPAASVIARYRAWFLANAKPLLGAAMLVGVYIFVFRFHRGKRLKG
jgi:hypothetical protein